MSLNSENFPKELYNFYIDKINNMPKSFLFFNLFDEKDQMHIEYDLDKKSNYSIKMLENKKQLNSIKEE